MFIIGLFVTIVSILNAVSLNMIKNDVIETPDHIYSLMSLLNVDRDQLFLIFTYLAIAGVIIMIIGSSKRKKNRILNAKIIATDDCFCNVCNENFSKDVEVCPICNNKLN